MANKCMYGCLLALDCSNAQPRARVSQVQIKRNKESAKLTFLLKGTIQNSSNDTIYWGGNTLFHKNGLIRMWRRNKQDSFPCSASPAQCILRSHSCLWYYSNTLHLCYIAPQSQCSRWCTPTLWISSSGQSHNKIRSLHATCNNMAMRSTVKKGCENNHTHLY